MVRAPFYDKNGVKKGAWSPEEDSKLKAYIERYGHWNWRELPKFAGLSRCGKSCRLRWMNYLHPDVKRGNYTKDEDDLIVKLLEQQGNKWSMIAAHLPGRTDNEVKNHWHTHLKKQTKRNKKTPKDHEVKERHRKASSRSHCQANLRSRESQVSIFESSPLSPDTLLAASPSEFSNLIIPDHVSIFCKDDCIASKDCPVALSEADHFEVLGDEDFWGQSFVTDTTYVENDNNLMCFVDGEFIPPYALIYDNALDLFYKVMQDFSINN